MNLRNKKQLAARLYGVGLNRVKFDEARLNDIKEAITKRDIKGLVISGAISIEVKHGASKSGFRARLKQKRKGRRQGQGSRKGKRTARLRNKVAWMNKIRAQRKYIGLLREKGYIKNDAFQNVYKKSGGGFFRSKRHIRIYLEENKIITKNVSAKKEKAKENGL